MTAIAARTQGRIVCETRKPRQNRRAKERGSRVRIMLHGLLHEIRGGDRLLIEGRLTQRDSMGGFVTACRGSKLPTKCPECRIDAAYEAARELEEAGIPMGWGTVPQSEVVERTGYKQRKLNQHWDNRACWRA